MLDSKTEQTKQKFIYTQINHPLSVTNPNQPGGGDPS